MAGQPLRVGRQQQDCIAPLATTGACLGGSWTSQSHGNAPGKMAQWKCHCTIMDVGKHLAVDGGHRRSCNTAKRERRLASPASPIV
jgi:hypothetical protein